MEKFEKVIDRVSYFYILHNVKDTYRTIDGWEGGRGRGEGRAREGRGKGEGREREGRGKGARKGEGERHLNVECGMWNTECGIRNVE